MGKIWSFLRRNKIIILVASAPILINYLLFTWRAPGLVGESSDWFVFLGSYLGFIGAISIALAQFKKEKESELEKQKINKRGYIVAQEINAGVPLQIIDPNKGARVIKTQNYNKFINALKSNNNPRSLNNYRYMRINLHGCDLILGCEVIAEFTVENLSGEKYKEELKSFVGLIEKGAEVYLPIFPFNDETGIEYSINSLKFTYTTIENESLILVKDYEKNKETLSIKLNGKETKIYKTDYKPVEWHYL